MFAHHLKTLIPLGGVLIFTGIAGFLYYKLLSEDEEDEIVKPKSQKKIIPQMPEAQVEVKIPAEVVGVIIGRRGANIKEIQELTSTSINFSDKCESTVRICIIKGSKEKVEKAKEIILRNIDEIPKIKNEEIEIPVTCVGRVIGRGGESIINIQRLSNAGVKVLSANTPTEDWKDEVRMCRIKIRGTSEQVETAKRCIAQKVKECQELKEKVEKSAKEMSDNRSKKKNENETKCDNLPELQVQKETKTHTFTPLSSKKFSEVFVSAVESPEHFWVQVAGAKTVELGALLNQMTEYYNDESNRELHRPEKIAVGDVVAAVFPADKMWYRGRVVPHNSEDDKSKPTIYYVDFGDTEQISYNFVCELRTDFLSLPFQAIECSLHGIQINETKREEATETFETLTHVAEWKPVMLKIVQYSNEEIHENSQNGIINEEAREQEQISSQNDDIRNENRNFSNFSEYKSENDNKKEKCDDNSKFKSENDEKNSEVGRKFLENREQIRENAENNQKKYLCVQLKEKIHDKEVDIAEVLVIKKLANWISSTK